MVLAKGSSSYGNTNPVEENCEDKSVLAERLQCRLEKQSSTDIPEACLDLTIQDKCMDFYDAAAYCYDLPNKDKDTCFRKESGYGVDKTNTQAQRFYINALLYELEEYVEDDFDAGRLSAKEASVLIADIITMKRALLSGQPSSLIKGLLINYVAQRGIGN